MNYTRLTKEQFEELHHEFALFLASQNIDKAEWEKLKTSQPERVEQQLDIFSDMIWEAALNKVAFLEHFSKNYIFMFYFTQSQAHSIVIQTSDDSVDFTATEGLIWLSENITSDKIEFTQGKKTFEDKNQAIFDLIRKGAIISDGKLYKQVAVSLELEF
ncbi:MAG TPA: DUF6495 family protein [Flavobacterium sp.]|nr:DUF6495 family protein [Flavobacterium sp.]